MDVSDASRIEYGDPVTYMVESTQAGIDEYVDSTLQAHRTYQYRIRARGADSASWSPWTEYVFSGAQPEADIEAPDNVQLVRDAGSVIVSWSAPSGDLDNYTAQRQQLIVVEGSTFFANVTTLGDTTWLPGNSTMYTDSDVRPDLTYEYRVAAVAEDQVGEYSDWFRVGPVDTSLGPSPENLRLLEEGARVYDERYEFWLGWDAVGRADDYEVQVVSVDLATGGQSMSDHVVSDATIFHTAFSRAGVRVRGRKLDADICGAAAEDRCLTEWTAWYDVRFTPVVEIDAPVFVDDTQDDRTMELRADLEEVIQAAMDPIGTDIDTGQVLEFFVIVSATVLATLSIAISWRRGMAPLGVGMGAAIFIMILFAGYRLLGTNIAWPIAAQGLVFVAGLIAVVRQFGVFR